MFCCAVVAHALVSLSLWKQYLDCVANAGTLSLGHNHPAVVQAMRDFLDSSAPQQLLDISSPYKDKFVSQLFSALPKELSDNCKIQMCGPAGADAIEVALKLQQVGRRRRRRREERMCLF